MSTLHPKLEESYRTLFNTMDEGFALCELVRDPQGSVIDYRILDANPSFAAHAGFTVDQVVGRLRSEINATRRRRHALMCWRCAPAWSPHARRPAWSSTAPRATAGSASGSSRTAATSLLRCSATSPSVSATKNARRTC